MSKLRVVIEVVGGVADVTQCPDGVEVQIMDWDNEPNCGFCSEKPATDFITLPATDSDASYLCRWICEECKAKRMEKQ